MQREVQFDDIYEFPPELWDFALFSCVCPVFISSAEQLSIYKTSEGYKCRCEVETISRNFAVSKIIKQQHGNDVSAELFTEYNMMKIETLFTQTAFKQYKPDVIPIVINVRFNKRDRIMGRFWVINTSIFSTVERVLKENAKRIAGFPLLQQRLDDDVSIGEMPCVVRIRAESAYETFYRAVPSRFNTRTKRFSIFLVDFGWFKWVLADDVIDISTMDKSNPIRNLPVAMIHCQEDLTNVLHAQEKSLMNNIEGSEGISSCKNLVNEICQQKLMAWMMLGISNITNHNLAAQSRHICSQHIKNEWHGSDFPERNITTSTLSDRPRNYFNEHNDGLSSKKASKFAKNHHMLRIRLDLSNKNFSREDFDNNSHRLELTSWEKAVAADHAIRTQGSIAIEEQATSQFVDNESYRRK